MDVAALAGVSMKTVSRVVNDEPHVRPALRQKVLQAIGELNYRPNLAARQLAGNRSFLISLIMFRKNNSYYSSMVVAAAAECQKYGYHLVSEAYDVAEEGEEVVRRVTANLRPDGIILAPPLCDDPKVLAALEAAGTPVVRLAGTLDGYGTIIEVEEEGVACDLVRHLIGLGHRRVAIIRPPDGHGAARSRLEGYYLGLAEEGIASDPSLICVGDFTFASGAAAMQTLLALADPPTAVFASNDGMALGALAMAGKMGLSVPRDVAVAGFDDSPAARMVYPPLTTVRQPIAEMTRRAVLSLLGQAMPQEPLRYELLIRGSTSGSQELVLSEMDA